MCVGREDSIRVGARGISADVKFTTTTTTFSYCLTSFLAFLRRLGFLGEAWIQPGGGLAVVT